MNELIHYALTHMPSPEGCLLILVGNVLAYVWNENAVLRHERRQEQQLLERESRGIELERKLYQDEYDQKKKRMNEQWVMIQEQSVQIYDLNQQVWELTIQLNAAKEMHLNLN